VFSILLLQRVVVVVPLSDLAVAVVLMELQVAQVAVVSLQEF
tara:strand:+ start:239 stop:364 length:126 start_codon:yes stop_codon:yes gene_type:complete